MKNIKQFHLYRNKYLEKPFRSWMFVISLDKETVTYFDIPDVIIAFCLILIIIPQALITFIVMFGPFVLWLAYQKTTMEEFNKYLK